MYPSLRSLVEGQPDPEKEATKTEKLVEMSKDPEIYDKLVRALGMSCVYAIPICLPSMNV